MNPAVEGAEGGQGRIGRRRQGLGVPDVRHGEGGDASV